MKRMQGLKSQKVLTSIGGIEYSFKPLTAKLSLEGFYKKYDDLPVDASLLTPDIYDQSDVMYSIGEGYSYGAEVVFTEKVDKKFLGFCLPIHFHVHSVKISDQGIMVNGIAEIMIFAMLLPYWGYKVDLLEK